MQWLAQRDHSRTELRAKLLRLLQRSARRDRVGVNDDGNRGGMGGGPDGRISGSTPEPAAEVDALLLWLEQHGHLCDARFTESRVHAREARFGNRRIQQELQQHGVKLDAQAKLALAQSEFDRARAVWQRKYHQPAEDAAARVRQMRFLAGRGFSMAVVQRVVKQGDRSSDDTAADDTTADDGAGGTAGNTAGAAARDTQA